MIVRLFAILSVIVAAAQAAGDDRIALAALYDGLGGKHWERSEGWLTDAPLGDWHGIVTAHGRVTQIDLAGNGLVGTLPYEVGDLAALERLDLRWNAISGNLPNELGALAALKTLLLTGNDLTGDIPWTLGDMSSMRRLDLSYNGLTGHIPGELGNLKSLESLGLHSNRLNGEIPWELSQARGLKRLVLSNNDLAGSLPIEFSDMPLLRHLSVAGNELQNAVGEENGAVVQEGIGQPVTAGELLDQTTLLMDDEAVRDFVGAVMSAIVIRNGFLEVNRLGLPDSVDPAALQNAIDGINGRLVEAGERVQSLRQLARAMQLYTDGGIRVPEGVSARAPDEGQDASAHSEGVSGAYEYTLSGSGNVTLTTSNAIGDIGINCPTLKPNYPHQSGHQPLYIVGNGQGACQYFGPPEQLTYKLQTHLEKRKEVWIFYFWMTEDVQVSLKEGISLNPVWERRETVARTPCSRGPGRFRTVLKLYITGFTLGKFYPHPGTYRSPTKYVRCSND